MPMSTSHQVAEPARVHPAKPVIGLAGGIGSGKSLVASQLAKLGCAVINADELSHQVLRQPEVRQQLIAWWGEGVLDEQGQINRKAVGQRVFNQPDELARLEALVHPRVHQLREALRERYSVDPKVKAIVEDCPLLYEVGLDKVCDVVIFVQARREVRLARVARYRGWSEAELTAREKNQLGLDIKADRADHVVDNSGQESQTLEQVKRILLKIIPDHKRQPE
jgi:dephospho-CoA kinase